MEGTLTGFLADLGVSADAFHDLLAKSDSSGISKFVVDTILTVDDFDLFKMMMIRRNMDLEAQVMAALGGAAPGSPVADDMMLGPSPTLHTSAADARDSAAAKAAAAAAARSSFPEPKDQMPWWRSIFKRSPSGKPGRSSGHTGGSAAAEKNLDSALAASAEESAAFMAQQQRYLAMLRELQHLPEAEAMAVAMQESMRAAAEMDDEERRQMELAIEESLRQMRLERAAGKEPAARSGAEERLETTASAALAADGAGSSKAAAPRQAKTLRGGQLQPATAPQAAAGSAVSLTSPVTSSLTDLPPLRVPGVGGLPPVLGRLPSTLTRQPDQAVIVTNPLADETPVEEEDEASSRAGASSHASPPLTVAGVGSSSMRSRAAGFKSSPAAGADSGSDGLRHAAEAAAETQRGLLATHRVMSTLQQDEWLAEQKRRLVASKQVARQIEMEDYQRARGAELAEPSFMKQPGGGAETDLEAKRAALREKLAARFKTAGQL